jgi:hypothetical protein
MNDQPHASAALSLRGDPILEVTSEILSGRYLGSADLLPQAGIEPQFFGPPAYVPWLDTGRV